MTYSHLLLPLCLIFSGCIRTSAREVKSIELSKEETRLSDVTKHEGFTAEYLVYSSAKWPISDFFQRLSEGEVKKAFQQLDIRYIPSNSDNGAIQKLLDQGLVPVFVKVTNNFEVPTQMDLSILELGDEGEKFYAIPAEQLPREFSNLNFAAIGANVANTVTVFVGIAVVIAASCGVDQCTNVLPDALRAGFDSSKGSDENAVYNPVMKTTVIDYKEYLFTNGKVEAGASKAGLVFFRVPSNIDRGSLKLHLKSLTLNQSGN